VLFEIRIGNVVRAAVTIFLAIVIAKSKATTCGRRVVYLFEHRHSERLLKFETLHVIARSVSDEAIHSFMW
jgi:hypothetical protein